MLDCQYHYNLYTLDNMRKGVDWFEKAIQRQPAFALLLRAVVQDVGYDNA